MTIKTDISLRDFDFWSGAIDTAQYLSSQDFDKIESILESEYPDGMTDTEVNDLFWFEYDWVAELLGYTDFEEIMEERKDWV